MSFTFASSAPNRSTFLLLPMLAAASLLTGCTLGTIQLDRTDPVVEVGSIGPSIQGSDYGGHAPIVGAKVYVLTPSLTGNPVVSGATTTTASKSLGISTTAVGTTGLNASGGNPTTLDTSGGVTNGMYYVTTDKSGFFNLTGDYTCSVNQVVYIAAVGGDPSYSTNVSTFTTSQVVVGAPSGGSATFTFSVIPYNLNPSTQQFYTGESIGLSGFSGSLAFLNGQTVAVTLTSLDSAGNSTFSAVIPTTLAQGTYGAVATQSGVATGNPTNNPAIVNMAALGLCPSSGSFAGTLQSIYMNEVSTVALAYAMAQFGTDAFHMGVLSGGPLDTSNPAYVTNGMKMALGDAALLYDIQGGNVSTATNAGEGHIGRLTTAAGNGTAPQAKVDTLGNILAACVDSQNTYNRVTATSGTQSPQCASLFNTATANGNAAANGGTPAADIAAAAFNIAHWPAGLNNSSFVSTLFNLPTGNVPFVPQLTSTPGDFMLEMTYTAPCTVAGVTTNLINGAAHIAIDGGNYVGTEYNLPANAVQEGLWISNYFGQPVKMLAATGAPDCTVNTGLIANIKNPAIPREIAIDRNNNVWVAAVGDVFEFKTDGTFLGSYAETAQGGLAGLVGISFEPTGRYMFLSVDSVPGNATALLKVDSTNGANVTSTNGDSQGRFSVSPCLSTNGGTAFTNAVDSNGFIYTVSSNAPYTTSTSFNGLLCVISPTTGANVAGTTTVIGGTSDYFNAISPWNAIGANNLFWGAAYFGSYGNYTDGLAAYNKSTNTSYVYGIGYNQPPGNNGGPNGSSSSAIDGAGSVWSGNVTDNGVAVWSPSNNYYLSTNGGYAYLNPNEFGTNGVNPAIDRAGNVWMAEQGTSSDPKRVIYELIGAGAPTVTPLYYNIGHGATGTNYVGQRPN